MNIKLIITTLFLTILSFADAQNLLIEATHSGGEMTLKWYPLRPTLWDSLNTIGYTIQRWQLDDQNQPMVNTGTTIAGGNGKPPILPKGEPWFKENGGGGAGYLEAVGSVLYDSTFQFPKNDLLDATEMRYSYLILEAQFPDNFAAEGLGLLYKDDGMTDGLRYRYEVSAMQNGQTLVSALIDMDAESGIWRSSDEKPEINIPDGKSLTDMSGRLLEMPIDVVQVIAKAYGDSIVLRWGVNHHVFWERANRAGFNIYKAKLGSRPDSIAYVKPWAEQDLSASIVKDSMALIAAQVLYGGLATQPENLYDQSSLAENRFGMALFSAERSALAADILGLRYVDKEVEDGETYIFIVECLASIFPTAAHFVEIKNEYTPPPAPMGLTAGGGDSVIDLEWSKPLNDPHFSSYIVERSDDYGETYHSRTGNPILFADTERHALQSYGFRDSVENNRTYHYRIRGLTAFAEISDPAETKATAKDLTPPPAPSVYLAELMEDTTTMEIKWRMDSTSLDLAGFKVLLGEGMKGDFDTLTNLLSKDVMTYLYKVPPKTDRTHFFKILAVDESGNGAASDVRYIDYPDLYPPDPPTDIAGKMTDEGIATIVWEHSKAKDVQGYWIYYAHDPRDLFVPLNKEPLMVNTYNDTIPLKTLNEVIYYYVRAEDEAYHRSLPSEVLELKRPDNVPPTAPFLEQPFETDTALILQWSSGTGNDVVEYELLKRIAGENTDWQTIRVVGADEERRFIDRECSFGTFYEYAVRCKDDADLYSEILLTRRASLTYSSEKLKVRHFDVWFDKKESAVRLKWGYDAPPVPPPGATDFKFYLFKSIGGEKVGEFVRVSSMDSDYLDSKVEEGALYNYAVMVVYDNGYTGALSSVKSVLPEN